MAGSAKHTMVLLDRDGTLIREMGDKRRHVASHRHTRSRE